MCAHVCMHALSKCMCVCLTWMKTRSWHQIASTTLQLIFEAKVCHWTWSSPFLARLDDQQSLGSGCRLVSRGGVTDACNYPPSSFVGTRDLNSGPHPYPVCALPTELSLQSLTCSLMGKQTQSSLIFLPFFSCKRDFGSWLSLSTYSRIVWGEMN